MIKLSKLSRSFGSIKAVDDISFCINDKEILGFLGPNGAGKTTTLRMLVGFLQPSSGSIELDGTSIFVNPLEVSRQIGYLPEQNPLYDEMNVSEALRFLADLRQLEAGYFASRRDFVVQNCGLKEVFYQRIGTLSKGYRQRVGLAQAILHDPRILILDEPTSGLDPNQIMEIRDLIRSLGKEKMVILSSHIMQEVQALCDRVIILNHGKVIVDDKKENLAGYLENGAVLRIEVEGEKINFSSFTEAHPDLDMQVTMKDATHASVSLYLSAQKDLRQEIARFISRNGWLVMEMHQKTQSMEDIFHALTVNRIAGDKGNAKKETDNMEPR